MGSHESSIKSHDIISTKRLGETKPGVLVSDALVECMGAIAVRA